MPGIKNSTTSLTLLSGLLLAPESSRVEAWARRLTPEDMQDVWDLATAHHVIMRTFPRLQPYLSAAGLSAAAQWAEQEVEKERGRITKALTYLEPICHALSAAGKVVVMKSLDHWPDLGSDLDLFAAASAADVVAIMKTGFEARLAERSWGDRLAHKWNFIIPGLPELVEVHVGRLGQTGEQLAVAESLVARARTVVIDGHEFRVPAPEERLIISTLQRMYRHFYVRLCDVIDNAGLVWRGELDYEYLRTLASSAGLWDGVATYLGVISDYVGLYKGESLELPSMVTSSAKFGGDQVYFRRNFIRIPLLPHASSLYVAEMAKLLLNGEIRNVLRLSLLPGLATAAAVEMKLTGSDKGIW
jgi:Uncharacterised nucleotidyltransferase